METLSNLAAGFQTAATLDNLLFCFTGVFLGTLIGVLPGIGSLAAVSMLLPITFYLEPTTALVMLAGVYYGGEYGGSVASILLNLPGTPSSAVTCLDGHPLARQGRAGPALFMTTAASFFGANVGILFMVFFSPLLVKFAMSFGPADYFAVMLLGLVAAGTISQGSPLKGVAMVVLGLMLGCIGTDVNTGTARLTGGVLDLADGVNLVALAMGLFGLSEIIASVNAPEGKLMQKRVRLREMIPTREDVRISVAPVLRGTGLGSIFGILPGTGQTVASFVAYAVEKKVTRTPERFGKGAMEGIASPEAANNAAAQTNFIPTLAMGIPGSATMALMLGALLIHGITPGPSLIRNHPEVFWGLTASFWIGNVILVFLNIPLIGVWVWLLRAPYKYLFPTVVVLVCIGVYSINNNPFDVLVALMFGLVGYVMRILEFEPAPLLIGFVLGPPIEENLRRAMLLARGDMWALADRPIAGTVLVLTALLLARTMYVALRPAAGRSKGEGMA